MAIVAANQVTGEPPKLQAKLTVPGFRFDQFDCTVLLFAGAGTGVAGMFKNDYICGLK